MPTSTHGASHGPPSASQSRASTISMAAATRGAILATILLDACAVGPSTRVTTTVAPVLARTNTPTPATARALLDSLDAARAADLAARPAGGAMPAADFAGAPTSRPLAVPARPAVDPARDLAWLDVLRDPQLVAFVTEAVTNNQDLREAQGRVREYRAQLGVARSGFLPQITAGVATSRNQAAFGPQVVGFDAVRATTDLSWELDFWGRLRRQTEAARFDLGAREADVRATTLTLVGDVATAYLQLREFDESVRIADETLASRRATLDLARRRYRQGVTSELDVVQFEAELADPAARVADFTRQRAQAENRLAVLLGRVPGPVARGRPLEEIVHAVRVPDSLPGALIARRPDVIAAERGLRASVAGIGAASASQLPAITLGGQYGTQRPDFTRLFGRAGEVYTLQAGVSVPLFTGGRLRNQVRVAEARADQTRARYQRTVLTALQESNDALAGARSGRDQLVAQATQARALGRAYFLAERRYQSGVSSYLEVLDAQRRLFAAQLALVQVQRQYLVSTVDLYRALGGGWGGAGASR